MTKYTLKTLLAAPKGKLEYSPGEAFMLHVFWESPSMEHAEKLLDGLRRCAAASHRDTPCTPTYFFRISSNDSDICSPIPRTLRDHPHLKGAFKKLDVGVPQVAVRAELTKRGHDPGLLDLSLDDELPQECQTQPVRVEFTEVYLDERAFMEHAGSRDYLDAYGVVMDPSLHYSAPTTIRLGTPPDNIVENILEPILKEKVFSVPDGCAVWQPPSSAPQDSDKSVFLSFDVAVSDEIPDVNAVAAKLSNDFLKNCSTCVAFPHPLRADTVRVMCNIPVLTESSSLGCVADLHPLRGEAHTTNQENTESFQQIFEEADLETVKVNAALSVGYVFHEKAFEARQMEQ